MRVWPRRGDSSRRAPPAHSPSRRFVARAGVAYYRPAAVASILCIWNQARYEAEVDPDHRTPGGVVEVDGWETKHPRLLKVRANESIYVVTVRPGTSPRIWLVAILREVKAAADGLTATPNTTPTVDVTDLVLSLKFTLGDKAVTSEPAKFGNSLQTPRRLSLEDCARLDAAGAKFAVDGAIAGPSGPGSRAPPAAAPSDPTPTFGLRRLRPGQGEFRRRLIEAVGARCLISGEEVEEVLEAAHIDPHAETGDDRLENGLLLRADLHALFDAALLAVEPESLTVAIHPNARERQYREFHGRRLSLPADWPIRRAALERRWQTYLARLRPGAAPIS